MISRCVSGWILSIPCLYLLKVGEVKKPQYCLKHLFYWLIPLWYSDVSVGPLWHMLRVLHTAHTVFTWWRLDDVAFLNPQTFGWIMATFLNLFKSTKRRHVLPESLLLTLRLSGLWWGSKSFLWQKKAKISKSALESFSVALILHSTLFATVNLFEKTH